MRKVVKEILPKEKPISVDCIKNDSLVGFIADSGKAFVARVGYTAYQAIELDTGSYWSIDYASKKSVVKALMECNLEIFVFDSTEEMRQWLAS